MYACNMYMYACNMYMSRHVVNYNAILLLLLP